MIHIPWYSIQGATRLAADAGLAKSTISQLVRGKSNPFYITVARIVNVLERRLSRKLDLREVVSETGTYPTKFVCEVVGCRWCLPDLVYHDDGSRKAEYAGIVKGQWTGDTAEFDGDHEETTE